MFQLIKLIVDFCTNLSTIVTGDVFKFIVKTRAPFVNRKIYPKYFEIT